MLIERNHTTCQKLESEENLENAKIIHLENLALYDIVKVENIISSLYTYYVHINLTLLILTIVFLSTELLANVSS